MTPHLDAALAAAEAAARVCVAVQATLVDHLDKADRSPVTVADFAAQAVVSEHLRRALPDLPLLGEEDAGALRENDAVRARVVEHVRAELPDLDEAGVLAAIDRGSWAGGRGRGWVLDPIDGTKGFLRGDQYAVALALVEDGAPVLGVLACPNLPARLADPEGPRGVLLHAERGSGAWQRPLAGGAPEPIHAARPAALAECAFCESVERAHGNQSATARVAAALGITAPPIRIDSQCKYAVVARGDAAVYLRLTRAGYREKVWDHAAGALVVTEAGGRVSDVSGAPLDFSHGTQLPTEGGIVATCGPFHDEVVAAVRGMVSDG